MARVQGGALHDMPPPDATGESACGNTTNAEVCKTVGGPCSAC